MAGGVVELDVGLFRELYPAYAAATDAQIGAWWDIACDLVGNAPGSRIPYDPPSVTTRKGVLYATLCHLAELNTRGNGGVGRISSAAEGSVNAQMSYDDKSGAAWWVQTQCGALVWQLLKPYRSGVLYFRGGCKY